MTLGYPEGVPKGHLSPYGELPTYPHRRVITQEGSFLYRPSRGGGAESKGKGARKKGKKGGKKKGRKEGRKEGRKDGRREERKEGRKGGRAEGGKGGREGGRKEEL